MARYSQLPSRRVARTIRQTAQMYRTKDQHGFWKRKIRQYALLALSPALIIAFFHSPAWGQSRIKDIVSFEGVRTNMLVGYGLVVGLNGTCDGLANAPFTRESLIRMLERLGVNAREDSLNTQNVAAVMITANLPPFANQGSRIDVTVSALGDATNLLGGTLLVPPLVGADGEIYASPKVPSPSVALPLQGLRRASLKASRPVVALRIAALLSEKCRSNSRI